MRWTGDHSSNPVKMFSCGGIKHIENENGDVLANGLPDDKAADEWCRRNGCRPIRKSWKAFNREGY